LIFFGESVRNAGDSALRAAQSFATLAARRRGNRFDGRAERRLIAIGLDDQHRAGVRHDIAAVRARELQRFAVEELERTRCRRLRHDPRDRRGRRAHVDVGRAQRANRCRQWRQFQRRLGDDGERAFGADHEPREIVAGRAFRRRLAGAECFAAAGDGAKREYVVARRAVLHRARSAGVARDVAADRAVRRRRRIGRPEQAMRLQRGLQIGVQHAGLDDCGTVRGIDREDRVHALERCDDTTCDRHGRASRVGAASARDERRAIRETRRDKRDDILVRRRKHDRVRHRLAPRIVVAVDEARRLVGREARVAERRAECVDQRRRRVHVYRFTLAESQIPALQSVYSNTFTTRSTPPVPRAISVTASSSSCVTLPMR
jgi:hypothetical protein